MNFNDKRIRVIVGHYGSGKSEFSVNYAMALVKAGHKTALADLDIANPYFRSRECQALLENNAIEVYSNTFGYDITEDLPAITARIRKPLEDVETQTIVDAGGNNSGARILNQFYKYFKNPDCDIFCVVNGNRFETRTAVDVLEQIRSIEEEINLKVTGLINNTHMVWDTTCEDILEGYELCKEVSAELSIPIKYNCCVKSLVQELETKTKDIDEFTIFPINMYLRKSWQ